MDSRMLSAQMAHADHCGTKRQGFIFPVIIGSGQWPVASDQWPVKINPTRRRQRAVILLPQNF
jgi:hypothetical protein